MSEFRKWDLGVLNSATKYPSIDTYHPIGDRGKLQPVPIAWDGPAIVTEKIDGTNARLVCLGQDFLIGSRNDWLHASGDLIHNPAERIVEVVRDYAQEIAERSRHLGLFVMYGEVYGAGIGGASKQYAKERRGFRVFDTWHMELGAFRECLRPHTREAAARWRDHGGQPFDANPETFSTPEVPFYDEAGALPTGLQETLDWLQQFKRSQAVLDEGRGQAEGVVIRSFDRKKIAKLRFEDYERTLNVRW